MHQRAAAHRFRERRSFEVTAFRGDHSLRIEVRDDGAKTAPVIRAADDLDHLEECGRGQELVALLASRWGQCGDEYGRSVFFELHWEKP